MKGEIKMTKKDKTTQETTFDTSSCMEMMEKMMGQQMKGCDCMSLFTGKNAPPDMQKMMSQMESCCGNGKEEAASQ